MASSSAAHDNGEFTDEEDNGIPLEDIREAEFKRLEDVTPSREAVRSPPRNKSSWLPWKRFKRRRRDFKSYLPVEEEDETRLLRKKPRNKPLNIAEVADAAKEFSCDSKLGWGILYFIFLCVACIFVLVAASTTGYIPNPLASHGPSNGTTVS